jgi:hypothetical protein
MTDVMTWFAPVLAKDVPAIFKLILPLCLIVGLVTVVGIAVMAITDLLKKKVPLVDESAEYGQLGSGDMTRYEAQSKLQPVMGKVFAAIFLVAVLGFFFGGLYTMGRGSSTTAQLRKEGKEKAKANLKRSQTGTSQEVGEDGDEGSMKPGGFSGMLGPDEKKE